MKIMNFFLLNLRLIFALMNLQLYMRLSDGLKWISRPSNETLAHVGSTVHITWHYNCDHRFGVSKIYYNGAPIFSRYANEQSYSQMQNVDAHFSVIGGSNVTIIIPDVDEDKRGSYCCDVDCNRLPHKICTTLITFALPRITYISPNLYGKQRDSITLRCNASGDPAPRVTWIHQDTNRTIAQSSVTSFNITGKASGGKYCCHVSNGFGDETNCTTFEVREYQPVNTEITAKVDFTVRNKTFQVVCTTNASPPATYFIQEGDNRVFNSSDGNITVTTLVNGSSINISCVAKKKYGEGEVAYLQIPICHKPEIVNALSSRNNISSIPGDTIRLRCVARGVPMPNITWYATDNQVISIGIKSYPGGSELTLTPTSKQDYGTYRCRAGNIVGVAWHNVTLTQKCECKGTYGKYKASSEGTISIAKAPVIVVAWLVLTIVSGTVNILLIFYIKRNNQQKRKEPFSAERNRRHLANDYNANR